MTKARSTYKADFDSLARRYSSALLLAITISLSACGRGGGGQAAVGTTPVITQSSGTFSHKSTAAVSGFGFGEKSPAAPVVWDDASGTSLDRKWDLSVPNDPPGSAYNLQYRNIPYRGVAGPHSNAPKYIVGGHLNDSGPYSGGIVMMLRNRGSYSNGAIYYASWYERVDPSWTSANNDLDADFKWFI